MIGKGTLVRYKGTDKRFYEGKMFMVHERHGDILTVWNDRKKNGKFTTIELHVKDVEEVC